MEEIKYSPKTDIGITNLRDIVPERMIKVFPYEFIRSNKSKTFIEGNAVTVAEISQAQLDFEDEHLKVLVDDGGKAILDANNQPQRYFEMFAAITSDAVLDFSAETSVYGQELKEEDSFLSISNFWYSGELEDIKIGNARFMPATFSIGKPYDKDEYENGNQAMFVATGIIEAKEGRAQYSLEEMSTEGLYEYSMINITSIEASFTDSRIFLHLHNENNAELTNPTIDDGNGNIVPGIEIQMEPNALINKITVKVGEGEDTTDLDLKTSAKLIPFKATPISNQDKLTMFFDWMDYDIILPEFIAKLFLGDGADILDLQNIDVDNDGKKEPFFGLPEIELIHDMLGYSIAFAESFGQFARNDSGSDAGKIKADLTIGSTKAHLVALEGKDPLKVIDGIYETYLRTYPASNGTTKNKAVKQIIAALSRYIYTTYAIGKGENSFNEAYLPWYLEPLTKMTLSPNGTNYKLATGKFKLRSRWFDVTQKDIEVMDETDISRIRLIQADRKFTMPELPDSIGALSKLPLPGDINTKSSQDLSYMWYLPFTSNVQLERLFLNSSSISIDNNNLDQDVNVPDGTPGKPTTFTAEDIINAAIAQYGVPKTTVTLSKMGSITKVKGTDKYGGEDLDFDSNMDTVGKYRVGNTITDEGVMYYLTNVLGYSADHILLLENTSTVTPAHGRRHPDDIMNLEWHIVLLSDHVDGATVKIASKITKVTMDREVLYDKAQWKRYITRDLGIGGGLTTFKLLSEEGEPISIIDEITIHSIWGDEVIITIKGIDFKLPLFNADDETKGVQRFLFT